MLTYLIAFGANLPSKVGGPRLTIEHAMLMLGQKSCQVINVSTFFTCPAFPAGNGPDYVNAVAAVRGPAKPHNMLAILHDVEAGFGRTRETRWGQRTLDLDLIAADDTVLPDLATHEHWRRLPLAQQMEATPDRLLLPHPRLQDRAFVLVPMAEVAGDWRHPILGKTVIEMRDALPAELLAEMVPLP